MKQNLKFKFNNDKLVRDLISHPVGDLLAGHVEVRHHRLPDELVLEIVLVHLCAVACDCRDTSLFSGFGNGVTIIAKQSVQTSLTVGTVTGN